MKGKKQALLNKQNEEKQMSSLFVTSESKFFEISSESSLRKAQSLNHKDAVKISSKFDETLTAILEELLYNAWCENISDPEAYVGRLKITILTNKHIGRINPLALCVNDGSASNCWLVTSKYRPNGLMGVISNSHEVRDYFMIKINASPEELKEIVNNLDK